MLCNCEIEAENHFVTSATAITTVKSRMYLAAPLIKAQESLLAHRPNSSIMPLYSLNGEYNTNIEETCQKLNPKVVEELTPQTSIVLKLSSSPKSNISKEKLKVLKGLRHDKLQIILKVHQGFAMVILDKKNF